jgi:hypothetical protein
VGCCQSTNQAKEAVMPAVSNKTRRPLSVPLPGGKTLHLGPGKTGQISAKAVGDARLKKLVDAGEIEIVDDESRPNAGAGGDQRARASFTHHSIPGGSRRSGDR